MLSIVLTEIEAMISRLSPQEQLWLLEKLARHLREGAKGNYSPEQADFKNQLLMMANDPEIKAEMKKINHEFAETETDGLETV